MPAAVEVTGATAALAGAILASNRRRGVHTTGEMIGQALQSRPGPSSGSSLARGGDDLPACLPVTIENMDEIGVLRKGESIGLLLPRFEPCCGGGLGGRTNLGASTEPVSGRCPPPQPSTTRGEEKELAMAQ